jgi:hypothetical protein
MKRRIMNSPKTPGRAARVVGNVLAALVLLGAPLGAIAALQPWQAPAGTSAPASGDDVVADGLKIVEPPLAAAGGPRTVADRPNLETVVRDWTYTHRPNPSPGH